MNRLLISLIFSLFIYTSVYSQDSSDEIVRVETSLVSVSVRVLDSNGKFIPNLKKEDFHIFENKIEQQSVGFETDNAPFTVALMLDVSDSAKFELKEIQNAASAFLKQLRSNDKVIVFAFDRNLIKVYEGDSKNLKSLQDSIQLTQTGGGTSLYDAVVTVVNNYLAKSEQRKKAIVLFSDGIDTTSQETYLKSLHTAQESNALIYSIQYNTLDGTRQLTNPNLPPGTTVNIVTAKGEPLAIAYKRGTTYLNLLSSNSGGRFYFADTIDNLSKAFSQIAGELSEQYVLSYYPENQSADSKKRNIKISTDIRNSKVKARKTYILDFKNK